MTTAYTSLLGLALPVTGELSGTWGDTVNNSITSLLDSAVAGTTNVSTDGDVTLTTTTGAANTAREAILLFSGARTALRTVTAPAQSKIYTVINATTGGFSVKLVGSGPTTGLTIPNGASAVVAWNGSDFVEVGAGSIGNLVVNGTLTVTGATTLQSTLAVTGNITNTAGTANGVAYLNGSKVVTSGSALTFDGTDFATTGGVLLNNARYYYGKSSGGSNVRLLGINSGDVLYLGIDSGPTSMIVNASSTSTNIAFNASGSEGMRLTSTGLGIGTSTVGARLTTQASANSYVAGALQINSLSGTYKSYITNVGGLLLFSNSSTVDQLILDSSGNLGLGVTPSAWGGYKAFQVGVGSADGAFIAAGNDTNVTTNAYFNAGWKYQTSSNLATMYKQTSGTHQWHTAPSGTAGNAITFTQAMTLDASGNLGVGVSSPSAPVDIQSNAGGTGIRVIGRASANAGAIRYFANDNTTQRARIESNDTGLEINSVANLPMYFMVNNAEGMRLTSTGLGIGTSSPSAKLNVFAGGVVARFGAFGTTTYDDFQIESYAGSTGIGCRGSSNLYFAMNGTTRMYLTSSGNFGIGTSAPIVALQVNSGSSFVGGFKSTVANGYIALQDSGTSGALTDGNVAIGAISNDLAFRSGGATRMRLDSAGNLGLGVTPSAWGSTYKVIQLPSSTYGGGSFITDAGSPAIAGNAYNNAGWKYVNNDFATIYQSRSGQHQWFTAASGTAGNAITFTQAMTLDASGRLGIGTTSPGAQLTVIGSAAKLYVDLSGDNYYDAANHVFRSFAGTERARIDSSGNLLVGTSTNRLGEKLHVLGNGIVTSSAENTNMGLFGTFGSSNLIIGAFSNLPVEFRQNNTERARIDSSGNLLVGTTGGSGAWKLYAVSGATQSACLFENPATSGQTVGKFTRTASDGTAIAFSRGGSDVGTISITTTATAYNTSSDYRLKNTIAPMTGALAKVALLKPCTYKWNADGSDGQGFIAHELAEVVPQAVTGEKDAVDEEGNPKYQGIDTSFLVATLTAAIQEQQAIIESLKARLDAANL